MCVFPKNNNFCVSVCLSVRLKTRDVRTYFLFVLNGQKKILAKITFAFE